MAANSALPMFAMPLPFGSTKLAVEVAGLYMPDLVTFLDESLANAFNQVLF